MATLPTSGTITLSQVAGEAGSSPTSNCNLNDPAVRALAGIPSGPISLADFYGLSSMSFTGDPTGTYNCSNEIDPGYLSTFSMTLSASGVISFLPTDSGNISKNAWSPSSYDGPIYYKHTTTSGSGAVGPGDKTAWTLLPAGGLKWEHKRSALSSQAGQLLTNTASFSLQLATSASGQGAVTRTFTLTLYTSVKNKSGGGGGVLG